MLFQSISLLIHLILSIYFSPHYFQKYQDIVTETYIFMFNFKTNKKNLFFKFTLLTNSSVSFICDAKILNSSLRPGNEFCSLTKS